MAVNGNGARSRLVVPVGIAVTLIWFAAGARALVIGDVAVFVVANVPFVLLCGYVFGVTLVRSKP